MIKLPIKKPLVTDKEWQQYIEDNYSNVQFCHPKKEDIEKFLEWRRNNDKKERSR